MRPPQTARWIPPRPEKGRPALPRAPGLAPPVEQLRSTLARDQLLGLAQEMAEAEFIQWLTPLFGADVPVQAYRSLRSALLAGRLPEPGIRLVEGGLGLFGHEAAYDRRELVIRISRRLVQRVPGNNAEAWKLLIILLEEYGHHLDQLLRREYSKVGGDAPLDEGARLAYALVNLGWTEGQVRAEFARLVTAQGEVPLEVEFSGLTRAVQRFLANPKHLGRDEKFGDLEFFGAGRGAGHAESQGHESIEDVLREAKFERFEIKRVYFGNWLRDYSQLVDPKLIRKPKVIRKQGTPAPRFDFVNKFLDFDINFKPSREALTQIVDVLARTKFEDTPDFFVTPQKLGVYRNEEHIDNPSGITDARSIDAQFRGACLPEELRVEPATLMKRYIRSGAPPGPGPARLHRVRDGETLESIALQNGLTWQALVLHNFGTVVPAEVNRYLQAKVGCTRRTANGRNYIFTSKDEPGLIEIPGKARVPGVEASYTSLHYLSEQLRLAVRAGRTTEGFRLLGHALHTLEDFFSHSNFVEVALVHSGAWVEPWVPARHGKKTASWELPIITGKFGGLDTAASLLLGIAEHMQKEVECTPGKPGATTKILLILLKDNGYEKTHATVGGLLSDYYALAEKYPELATLACENVKKVVHRLAEGFGGMVHAFGSVIDDAQTAFLENPNSTDPTHSQLAKDHDDHPLHALAAELASGAALDVGRKIQQAWKGGVTPDDVVATAAQYFVHPAHIRAGEGSAWVLDKVHAWIPGHGPAIARLSSRSWTVEWTRRQSVELKDLMERAQHLMKGRR